MDKRDINPNPLSSWLQRWDTASHDEKPALEAEIRNRFQRTKAVLISDMAGFSKITQSKGIIHFLSMINRMERLSSRVIEEHRGHVVKAVADNLFATFEAPQPALAAAIALHQAFDEEGAKRPEDERIALSIGLSWGDILDIDGRELWGNPVNIASKLGEDIGDGGDILVASELLDQVDLPGLWRADLHRTRISGVDVSYGALRLRRSPP